MSSQSPCGEQKQNGCYFNSPLCEAQQKIDVGDFFHLTSYKPVPCCSEEMPTDHHGFVIC